VPKDAPIGTQTLTVTAAGDSTKLDLPLSVTLAKDLPAKLTVSPQLPELRGTSKSPFEYQLSIKNDSGKKLTVSLAAQAPPNFNTSFTEQYGSQELNAVPIDAGQSKDVKLKVTPPNTTAAGQYKVTARVNAEDTSATTELGLDITPGRLLVVGWAGPDEVRPRPVVHFVFDGGVLAGDAPIQLQQDELDDYRFVAPADAPGYLPPIISARVAAAVRSRATGTTAYLPWSDP